MYPYNPWNQKNSGIEWSGLFIDVIILALTFEVIEINHRNVMLNAQSVKLERQNVINNRKSAESEKQALEILKEINSKI